MPTIACQVCGANTPRRSYYQCRTCQRCFCHQCGEAPVRKGSGFWGIVAGCVQAGLGDTRCEACFDAETAEGGEAQLVYRPPASS